MTEAVRGFRPFPMQRLRSIRVARMGGARHSFLARRRDARLSLPGPCLQFRTATGRARSSHSDRHASSVKPCASWVEPFDAAVLQAVTPSVEVQR